MRDILEDIPATSRSTRPSRRGATCGRNCASGFTSARVSRDAAPFAILLDGRPVKNAGR